MTDLKKDSWTGGGEGDDGVVVVRDLLVDAELELGGEDEDEEEVKPKKKTAAKGKRGKK